MLYDSILDKFKFECSRGIVKFTVTNFRKKKKKTNIFITLAPTFMDRFSFYFTRLNYDNILGKFEYKHSKAKVKVTVVIFRKKIITLAPLFIDRF